MLCFTTKMDFFCHSSAARVHYVHMLSQTSSSNFILLMGLCHTPYGGLGTVRRGSARLDVMYYVTSAPIAFLISFHEARLDAMYDVTSARRLWEI